MGSVTNPPIFSLTQSCTSEYTWAMLPERFLTPEDVAVLVGMHVETVRKMCRQGRMPGAKVGREWRFSPDVLERWIEGGGLAASQQPEAQEKLRV